MIGKLAVLTVVMLAHHLENVCKPKPPPPLTERLIEQVATTMLDHAGQIDPVGLVQLREENAEQQAVERRQTAAGRLADRQAVEAQRMASRPVSGGQRAALGGYVPPVVVPGLVLNVEDHEGR